MAKQRPHQAPAPFVQAFNRVGEGAPLEVVGREFLPGPHGQTVSLQFNLAKAPVPDRQYVATLASVVKVGEFVHLLFGQKKTIGSGLRSLVDVQITPESIRRFNASTEGFQEARGRSGIDAGSLSTLDEEPPQTVGLSANIFAVSFNGIESTIDLYKISPFVMGNLAQGGNLLADPVVRVSLPTQVTFAVLDEFARNYGVETDDKKAGSVP